jgi:hypothetical protein
LLRKFIRSREPRQIPRLNDVSERKWKIDLTEIGWEGMDWIDLAEDRDQWRAIVNTVINLRVPLNAGKFLSGCTTGSFSGRSQLLKVSKGNSRCLF